MPATSWIRTAVTAITGNRFVPENINTVRAPLSAASPVNNVISPQASSYASALVDANQTPTPPQRNNFSKAVSSFLLSPFVLYGVNLVSGFFIGNAIKWGWSHLIAGQTEMAYMMPPVVKLLLANTAITLANYGVLGAFSKDRPILKELDTTSFEASKNPVDWLKRHPRHLWEARLKDGFYGNSMIRLFSDERPLSSVEGDSLTARFQRQIGKAHNTLASSHNGFLRSLSVALPATVGKTRAWASYTGMTAAFFASMGVFVGLDWSKVFSILTSAALLGPLIFSMASHTFRDSKIKTMLAEQGLVLVLNVLLSLLYASQKDLNPVVAGLCDAGIRVGLLTGMAVFLSRFDPKK